MTHKLQCFYLVYPFNVWIRAKRIMDSGWVVSTNLHQHINRDLVEIHQLCIFNVKSLFVTNCLNEMKICRVDFTMFGMPLNNVTVLKVLIIGKFHWNGIRLHIHLIFLIQFVSFYPNYRVSGVQNKHLWICRHGNTVDPCKCHRWVKVWILWKFNFRTIEIDWWIQSLFDGTNLTLTSMKINQLRNA